MIEEEKHNLTSSRIIIIYRQECNPVSMERMTPLNAITADARHKNSLTSKKIPSSKQSKMYV